jgi:hypothetical protein
MPTISKIIRIAQQGPAGPQGTPGTPGSNANVTAATVLAAIQAMDAGQKTDLMTALGIVTYAGLAAANAALQIGEVFRDSTDSNQLKTATA